MKARRGIAVLLALGALGGATACGEDEARDAVEEGGSAIEEGAEDVGGAVEEGAEDAGDAAKDAGKELEEEIDGK